jgi:hypothetical protein
MILLFMILPKSDEGEKSRRSKSRRSKVEGQREARSAGSALLIKAHANGMRKNRSSEGRSADLDLVFLTSFAAAPAVLRHLKRKSACEWDTKESLKRRPFRSS